MEASWKIVRKEVCYLVMLFFQKTAAPVSFYGNQLKLLGREVREEVWLLELLS